ncbi:MAG: ribosomal L7Ae/L30e/S12e/Gadd45 family protein [Oscillospiraceae bacterium]|nr:ribosomal L7Ae/L30e/S12e/Gadd45 family protein [Oscillospiraceae bacterium]MDD4413276.1 ribosomal L7Ae/L30e/S12e/Gadd45 family protein [Oscillospiraceae bacterium]
MSSQEVSGRLGGLLGMARRGGRLTTGFNAVVALITKDKEVMVMLAADLSEKTEKELRFAARSKDYEIVRLPLGKEDIGQALGLTKPVGVLALEDKGFAATVRSLCRDDGDSKEELLYADKIPR